MIIVKQSFVVGDALFESSHQQLFKIKKIILIYYYIF